MRNIFLFMLMLLMLNTYAQQQNDLQSTAQVLTPNLTSLIVAYDKALENVQVALRDKQVAALNNSVDQLKQAQQLCDKLETSTVNLQSEIATENKQLPEAAELLADVRETKVETINILF